MAASQSASITQCANGPDSDHQPCLNGTLNSTTYANWVNGNVNATKAHWAEGQFLPYRTIMSGMSSGDHTLVLQYEIVHGGKHAIDYLGSYDATETTSPVATPQNRNDNNPCYDILGTNGCTAPGTPPVPASTIPVPPADLAGEATCGGASWLGTPPVQQPGTFDLFAPGAAGAALTSASYPLQNLPKGAPGNCATAISVSFRLTGTAPAGGWTVVLTWGGHIASALDWGVGNSASSISGSPYHMSLISLDGQSTGSQDMSLQAAAVAPPPAAIATQVSPASITQGNTVTDTATLSGSNGTVTGSVQYFLCTGTTGCDQGKGTLVGAATLSGGQASLPFGGNLSPGSYCVGIAYVNDGKSFYSSTYSGSPTNECFTVTQASAPVLSVVKTADHGTVSAGDQIGYVIRVSAGGTGTAHDVTMTDTLPANAGTSWSVVSADTTGGWSCSISAGGTLTCGGSGFDLAAGQSASVHVVSPTTSATCGTVTNQAHVTSSNAAAADSSQAAITVGCPSLSIVKTPDASSVSAGDQAGYTIRVSNAGPGTARDVVMTDTLPADAGLSWSIVPGDTTGGWSCSIVAGKVTCGGSGFDLAGGESASVHVVSPTTSDTCGTVTNRAHVTITNGAPEDSDAAVITVQCASIAITKKADAASVNAGDQIGYTITVTNTGQGAARQVAMSDPLPSKPGLSWSVDSTAGGWSCSITSGKLSCGGSGFDLAGGASATVHIVSPTTGSSCGPVSNTAFVSTSNDGTAHASDSVTVNCSSLSITKTADASSVSAGDQIGYTITVSNAGPGTARGVTLSDVLPAVPSQTWSLAAGSDPSCSITGAALDCGPADLAAGASLKAHVTSPTNSAACGTYANIATFGSANDGSGTSGIASIEVRCAQIELAKTPDAKAVSAGDQVGFTITATNDGTGTARDVTMTDPLPVKSGVSWSIVGGDTTGGWSCSISSGTLTCGGTGFDLTPGATASVHVVSPTTADSCGILSNRATATESNLGLLRSATAFASVIVLCARLSVTKVADASSVNAGDQIGYTIVVTNGGSGTARQVTLTDPLPAASGVSWTVDSSAGGWSCSISAGKMTCGGAGFDLAPGATATAHVASATSKGSCGTLDNTASVTSSNDGSPSASASIVVNCASITITKKADASSVVAGDQVGFVITVTNTGPGTARQVTMNDLLPTNPGLSWSVEESDTRGGWSCSISAGQLTCGGSGFDLAGGASASVHIVSPTTGRSCGNVPNTASVITSNDGTASASDSVTVNCPVLSITKVADAASVSAGDQIGYKITVTNAAAAGTARGVTISDMLPAVPGGSWSVASGCDPSCAITGNALSCGPVGLAPGASLTAHVTSPTSAASCGSYQNTATFGSGNDGSGVSDPASVEVRCAAIELVKKADAGSVSAGDQVGFTITATNRGDGTARDVTMTDPLPGPGTSWSVQSASAGWSCTVAAAKLTCGGSGTSLDPGASLTVHVISATTKDSCGILSNTASVTTSNDGSATAVASVDVRCATIAITKTPDAGSVSAGDQAGYTITVTNNGTGTARDVTMTDPLPAQTGVSWSVQSASAGWSCSISSGTLTCGGKGTSLDPGASLTVHVTSPTTAASCGSLDNTASVTTSNDGSGRASASVVVRCAPSIVTRVSRVIVPVGTTITDTATLTGTAGTVTGTVDFHLCAGTITGCPQGSGVTIQTGVPLANGSATSAPFGNRLPPGRYCVGVAYHNDGKSPYPDAYSGSPKGECFIVVAPPGPMPPVITTKVSMHQIHQGGSVRDTATLTGKAGQVTGTVDFVLCSHTTTGCPQGSGVTIQSGVLLTDGSATSRAFGRHLRPGRYCVGVAYHNDGKSLYADAYSGSPRHECFIVIGKHVVVTTRLSRHLIVGAGTVRDVARLHHVRQPVHGSVQYRYYPSLSWCKADTRAWPAKPRHGHFAGLVRVHGTVVAGSRAISFRKPGTFYWAAFYSGDGKNLPAASRCLTEVLRVRKLPTRVTTWLSRHVIWRGQSVLDWATVHARTRVVTGTVQFRYYSSLHDCRLDTLAWPARPSRGTFVDRLGVHGNRTPDTRLVKFGRAGTFYWAAFYSGDSQNAPSASSCLSELLKVK